MTSEIPPPSDSDAPTWSAEVTRPAHVQRPTPRLVAPIRAVPAMAPIARAVVGYLVLHPDRLTTLDLELCSDDIVDTEAKVVWSAILNLREEGQVIDLASIEGWMIGAGWPRTEAPAVIGQMIQASAIEATVHGHVARLRAATKEREEYSAKLAASLLPPMAWQIGERPTPAVSIYTTPFPELDNRIGGGLTTRSTTIVVSRTGAGKSGLVIGFGVHLLRAHGVPFLYASSELDDDECFARCGASILGVSHRDVYFGKVRREEVTESLRGLKLHVLDRRALRVDPLKVIGDQVKRLSDHYGVAPAVCVDFLQDLVADKDEKSIRMGTSSLAGAFRDMGSDLDVVMLLVASTGRQFYKAPKEGADDPISYLGTAKESGDVEYAASNLLFLDVDAAHSAGLHRARIVVAKARRGEAGFVGATFDGPSGRWAPSAESAEALRADNRNQADTGKQLEEEDAKVLAKIAKNPMRSWNTLRDGCGISKTAADRSKGRLLETGQIETVEETYLDATGKRTQRRMVLRVTGTLHLNLTAPQQVPAQGSEGGVS